jgi:hypothetical protein
MVIDIARGGDSKYLIRGSAVEYWFEGVNDIGPEYNDVKAKWAKVGDVYAGTWVENGTKYLFSFELEQPDG